MRSKKNLRDKIATHTFFRQEAEVGCSLGCCSCSTSKNDGYSQTFRFHNINPRDYHAATDEFDKISKNFKTVLAEEDKRRKANRFIMTMPDHWGLSFLESWEKFADQEAAQSLQEFERYKKEGHQAQEMLQIMGPEGSPVPLPADSKFFSLMIEMEHLNNVMFRCRYSATFFNVEKKFGFPEECIQEVSPAGQNGKKG